MNVVLEDRMDRDFGLLDKLLSIGTLNRRELQEIKCLTNSYAKNNKLLSCIEEKGALDQLATALRETNQTHLANYLSSHGAYVEEFGGDWPLSDEEIQILDFNQVKLMDLIEPTELVDHLLSKNAINMRQHRVIKANLNEIEKNELLIEIWRRCSRRNYKKVIECLDLTEQCHIAKIMNHGRVIWEIHAAIQGDPLKVHASEMKIVDLFKELLRGKCRKQQQQIMELVQPGHDDVQLISVKVSGSVSLYFHCTSLPGVMHLYKMLSDGSFKSTVDSVFSELLLPEDEEVSVVLCWLSQEYLKCKTYFPGKNTSR